MQGPSVWSESEVESIRDFILERQDNIKLFIGLHSYSQYILLPFGDTFETSPDFDDQKALADAGNEALAAADPSSVPYSVGTFRELLYAATGCSQDWAYDSAGIKYSYTLELRPDTPFEGGFVLPPEEILPNSVEVWAFVRRAAVFILDEIESGKL